MVHIKAYRGSHRGQTSWGQVRVRGRMVWQQKFRYLMIKLGIMGRPARNGSSGS